MSHPPLLLIAVTGLLSCQALGAPSSETPMQPASPEPDPEPQDEMELEPELPSDPEPAAEPPAPTPPLSLRQQAVMGRRYRVFSPGKGHIALRLSPPAQSDPHVLLSVAGTYTSPRDHVEGTVIVDGELRSDDRRAWEGVLLLQEGRARIERRGADTFSRAAMASYRQRRASLLQGHLLVYGAEPRPLKPSLALHRRALATHGDAAFIVDSHSPVPLPTFAADLVELGAERALNLDMGAWSAGFYRAAQGTPVPLGQDHSATAQQSNWLVVLSGP